MGPKPARRRILVDNQRSSPSSHRSSDSEGDEEVVGDGNVGLVDPLRTSPLKPEYYDEEEAEVMELADPRGYLQEGTPLVFTIPSQSHPAHRKPSKDAEDNHPAHCNDGESSSSRSSPSSTSPEKMWNNKYTWLTYPNKVLNKMKEDMDWTVPYRGRKKRKPTSPSYITSPLKGVHRKPGKGKKSGHVGNSSSEESGWETMSSSSSDSSTTSTSEVEEVDEDGEWEETTVYVELDDLPSIQELFAVQPDHFLRFQHRRFRHQAQPFKATHPKLTFQFHEFDSEEPIVQIGKRFFAGTWEEPTGSALFFRKKSEGAENEKEDEGGKCSSGRKEEGQQNDPNIRSAPLGNLKNLVPDPAIPYDPVFGTSNLNASDPNSSSTPFELVRMADKVLKTKVYESGHAKTTTGDAANANKQFVGKFPPIKIPSGYDLWESFSGPEYIFHKTKKWRKKIKKGTKRNAEGQKVNKEATVEMITGDLDQEVEEPEVEVIAHETELLNLRDRIQKKKRKSIYRF